MDEPSALLRGVMFHFAGGDALFVALLAIAAVSLISESRTNAWRWTLATFLAVVWGALASPAWPMWAFVLAVGLLISWRVAIHRSGVDTHVSRRAAFAVRCLCLAVGIYEISITSSFQAAEPLGRLCVIGDSVTAGLNDGEFTWPQRFAQQTGIAVRDASQPGATLRSAVRQAERLQDDRSPLLLEIGGNDVLSGRSLSEFRDDCETLCKAVARPGRRVWMCELPLPPLCARYGFEQRRICRQHGIRLISKRKMMSLLTTSGATVDSIHLSPPGQEQFGELVISTLGCPPANNGSPGDYEKLEPKIAGR